MLTGVFVSGALYLATRNLALAVGVGITLGLIDSVVLALVIHKKQQR